MKRPLFLQNPRMWTQTQRQQFDPSHYSAGSVYRAGWIERLYWRFIGGR